jgi:hypothetical protein
MSTSDFDRSHNLGMFIVDVLRHDDLEPLSSILNLLNNDGCIGWRQFWTRSFRRDEVLIALTDLIEDGLVVVFQESSKCDKLVQVCWDDVDMRHEEESTWFSLTAAGQTAWMQWQSPQSE